MHSILTFVGALIVDALPIILAVCALLRTTFVSSVISFIFNRIFFSSLSFKSSNISIISSPSTLKSLSEYLLIRITSSSNLLTKSLSLSPKEKINERLIEIIVYLNHNRFIWSYTSLYFIHTRLLF